MSALPTAAQLRALRLQLLAVAGDDRLRPAIVMAVGAIEDTLGLPRSFPRRRDRRAARRDPCADLTHGVEYLYVSDASSPAE